MTQRDSMVNMRQTPLLLLLLLLHGSGAGAGGDNMKLMKEMFEIQDRYTSARLQNPALDSLFRGVAALTKAEIKVGAATVVGVLSTMQIDTGSVDVAEYTAMVYDAAAETDAGSLKLSDVRTIMAKAAAHFGVSDATLSAVARMVVARFNGLTYEEAVTLSVEFLETVSDMFMGERVKGVAVRQHVGKVVRVVAESCMEAAQESPLFDSATKINVDPSLLDNLDSGSMGALGATTVTEALALFGEIRHVFNVRLDLVNMFYVLRRAKELAKMNFVSKAANGGGLESMLTSGMQYLKMLAKQTDAKKQDGMSNIMQNAMRKMANKQEATPKSVEKTRRKKTRKKKKKGSARQRKDKDEL